MTKIAIRQTYVLFNDKIHGRVFYGRSPVNQKAQSTDSLSVLISKIFKTPDLLRLSLINKYGVLGLIDNISQGRLEHSFGVCHLSNRWINKLRKTYPSIVSKEIAAMVPIGGLLHDVGNIMFSHAGEKALSNWGYNHEKCLASLLKDNDNQVVQLIQEFEREERVSIINPLITLFSKEAQGTPLIARQLLDAWALNADRVDNILRDISVCGLQGKISAEHRFSNYDLDTLTQSLDITLWNGEPSLCINQEGLPPAARLLLSRSFLYNKAFRRGKESLAEEAFKKIFDYIQKSPQVISEANLSSHNFSRLSSVLIQLSSPESMKLFHKAFNDIDDLSIISWLKEMNSHAQNQEFKLLIETFFDIIKQGKEVEISDQSNQKAKSIYSPEEFVLVRMKDKSILDLPKAVEKYLSMNIPSNDKRSLTSFLAELNMPN